MRIVDGVAYADNFEAAISIVSVRPMENHKLWLKFSTGETKVFDFSGLLDFPAFRRLKNKDAFDGVYLDCGVPVWLDGEIDYCPYTLYKDSVAV